MSLYFTARGGTEPYTWTANNLPDGLLFSNADSGDTNRGWLRGTPEETTTGTTVTFICTDADGTVDSVARTVRVNAAGALTITSPAAGTRSFTIGEAVDVTFTATGGTPPYTWTNTTAPIPGDIDFNDTGTDGELTSAAVTGSAGQTSETFQVEDSLGATDEVTLTIRRTVEPDDDDDDDTTTPPAGAYNRNIGIVAGVKSTATAIANVGAAIQDTDAHPSTERCALIRLGLEWANIWSASPAATRPHMSGDTYVTGTYRFTDSAGRIAAINNIDQANTPVGHVLLHAGLNYTASEFQQTFSLGHGTASAGNSYITLDNLPTNPHYPGREGSAAGDFIGLSIHGPGIPTGGAPVTLGSFSGNQVRLNGIGSRLTSGSGEYWLGGTSNVRDIKLGAICSTATNALSPYGDFVKQMVDLLGGRCGRIEMSNEINHRLGCAPYPDVPLQYRNLCQGYVGAKLANPDIIVCTPGTGNHNPAGESSHLAGYLHPKTWLRKIKEEHTTNQPNYFTNLCNHFEITSPNGLPFDSVSIHPYTRGPFLNPATNVVGDAAWAYNLFNGRAKVALTEQGPGWVTSGGNTSDYPLTKQKAYEWWRDLFDILHGNVKWPYGQLFNGPAAILQQDSTSLEDRRAMARQVFDVATCFVISAPLAPQGAPGTPSYEDSADMGLHTYANPPATGTPKWTTAGPDPIKACREA